MSEEKCKRCGMELRTITVRVPVYLSELVARKGGIIETSLITHYEEREELCECPRCQGAY
jgi:hypothetical protein